MMDVDSSDVADGYAGEGGISPTLDATLDLLSNRRRRYVLYSLRKQGGPVTLDDLAERVASWEDDAESTEVRRVRTDLYHCQLPRMESAGVVSFDADEEFVRLADGDSSPLDEYLDLAADEESVV